MSATPASKAFWTKDRIKKMLELNDGRSASAIADAIGATRNQVIGKIGRMDGVSLQGKSNGGPKAKPFRIPGPRTSREEQAPTFVPEPPPALESNPTSLLDVKHDQCRYPLPDGMCCGAKGYPYCNFHRSICFQPMQPRKSA